MSESAVDTLARGAAEALSRRRSLAALSGVALATGLMGALGTEAAQSKAKKVKKKDKKRCNKARERCRTLALQASEGEEEQEALVACCENCRSGDFLSCFELRRPVDDKGPQP